MMDHQTVLYSLAGIVISVQSTAIGILWGKWQAAVTENRKQSLIIDCQSERIGYTDAVGHAVRACNGAQPCPLAKTFDFPSNEKA